MKALILAGGLTLLLAMGGQLLHQDQHADQLDGTLTNLALQIADVQHNVGSCWGATP